MPTFFAPSGDQVFVATQEAFDLGKLWAASAIDFGAWLAAPLGVGCEGSGGLVPRLTSSGEATVGSSLVLDLEDAAPNAVALLLVSVGTGYIDLRAGCALWLDPTAVAVPVTTDSVGSFQLPVSFNATHLGLHLSIQFAVADTGSPGGALSVSNALELLVGAG